MEKWQLGAEEDEGKDKTRTHRLSVDGGWLYRITSDRPGKTDSPVVVFVPRTRYDPTKPPNA